LHTADVPLMQRETDRGRERERERERETVYAVEIVFSKVMLFIEV